MKRKRAAILAAEVVGYSRLMETDEAGALAGLGRVPIKLFHARMHVVGKAFYDVTVLPNLAAQKTLSWVRSRQKVAVRAMSPSRPVYPGQQTVERELPLFARFRLLDLRERTFRAMLPFVWF
ncbi:MAG: hypothetical protein O7A68_11035 [Alphaproteobacteria bacterium]|nr:hypothetical protein [Alphaproteobacteria bacterium]